MENRRGFLKKVASGLAGAVAVCIVPKEEIVVNREYPKKAQKLAKFGVDLAKKGGDRSGLTIAKVRKGLAEMDMQTYISTPTLKNDFYALIAKKKEEAEKALRDDLQKRVYLTNTKDWEVDWNKVPDPVPNPTSDYGLYWVDGTKSIASNTPVFYHNIAYTTDTT